MSFFNFQHNKSIETQSSHSNKLKNIFQSISQRMQQMKFGSNWPSAHGLQKSCCSKVLKTEDIRVQRTSAYLISSPEAYGSVDYNTGKVEMAFQ